MVYTGTIAFAGSFSSGALAPFEKIAVAAASGFAAGGVAGGTLESAFKGALTAVLFAGVGNVHLGGLEAVAAHAVVGCVSAGLSDGSCGKGAMAAGFAKGVGAPLTIDNLAVDTITHAVLGGIGASIAGGKFANGAVTGAFGYLFNACLSGGCRSKDVGTSQAGNVKPENHVLRFDGVRLGWYDDAGKLVHSWSAVSGADGFQSAENQHIQNKGPIPEGMYTLEQANYQQISIRDEVGGVFGRGAWPGGVPAWGAERVWITPIPLMSELGLLYGRANFSIHGGWSPGSAGCIDMTVFMRDFAKTFRAYGKDLSLVVSYQPKFRIGG